MGENAGENELVMGTSIVVQNPGLESASRIQILSLPPNICLLLKILLNSFITQFS